FDLLGLQDYFPVFESEREAFPHYLKKASAPAVAPPPARRSPSGSEGAGGPPKPSGLSVLPLTHPRWIVLLQTVSERLGFGVFEDICRRLDLPSAGGPAAVFGRIVRSLRSPEELLALFDEATLGELSRLYHLP